MKIIDASVRNGTAVVVGMILVILFGFVALSRIPIQLNPTIDRPIISVETQYPGAAPNEVEIEITQRQEQRLAAVENLRRLRSFTREGSANVMLEFDWGVDKNVALIDIVQRLETVRNLPDEVEKPQIRALNTEEEQPVIRATIESQLPYNVVRNLLEDRVGPQLERVPGVGSVRWHGGSRREIQVKLDLAALESRQVTVSEVLSAIAWENQNTRGGKIEEGNSRLLVRTVGQYTDLESIRKTVVKSTDEGLIRVEDIAEVLDTFGEREAIGRTMGQPAVNLSISKKNDTNTLTVTEGVKREIDKINQELEPMGIRFWINYDASEYIWEAIFGVRRNLLIGATLAVVALFLFLRSFPATLAISLTIPLCLVGTFVLLAAFGRSINVISLAGLAFAAGMVVDNAVVVMENIFRHRVELGSGPARAARDAASEVWPPILASTLTTLAVFIPILFVREEAGQLFRDIAYSISFAVGLSMLAAVTVVPMVGSRLLRWVPGGYGKPGASPGADPPARRRTYDPARLLGAGVRGLVIRTVGLGLRNRPFRFAVIGALALAFVLSLGLIPPAEYLPQSQSAQVFGQMLTPSGTSLDGADRQVRKIESYVLNNVEHIYRAFFVVRRDRTFFGIFLEKEHAKPAIADRLIAEMQDYAARVLPSDVNFSVYRASDFRWSGEGKGLSIDLTGPELPLMAEMSQELENQLRLMPEVRNVRSSYNPANPELHVVPDRERLADLGMTSRDLALVVETLLEGTRVSLYRDAGKEYDLVVKAKEGQILDPDDVRGVALNTPAGRTVRLDEVATVYKGLGPVTIERLEQERVITLYVTIEDKVPLQTFIEHVQAQVVDPMRRTLPAAYRINLSGTADDLARTMDALASSFLFALVIIYLLMSALFESFLYPLIIMLCVPLSTIGAILGVWVFRAQFNVITMLGFVMLAGIVVNNGILLIDFSLRGVRSGLAIHEAIAEAVRVRVRPIFMTSTTTIIGMLPLAFGRGGGTELYSGLGVAVVGGMALSTLFTLVLVPFVLATALEVTGWVVARGERWLALGAGRPGELT